MLTAMMITACVTNSHKPPFRNSDSSAKHSDDWGLLERLDDGGAKCWEIGWGPAGDQIAINDHFLVDDFAAGISQVGADARIRSHRSPGYHVRLHQGPGTVANGGDGLAGVHEVPHERHSRTIQSKLVRVHRAPRENQRVEVVDGYLRYRAVDLKFSGRLQIMITCLYVIGFQRYQLDLCTLVAQHRPRLFEFDLLDAIGGQDRYPLALQCV